MNIPLNQTCKPFRDFNRILSIDIETFSNEDLKSVSTHKYAASPLFEILLFAYSYDLGEPIVIDLANGEKIPEQVISDLHNPAVVKTAHNATFETLCLAEYFGEMDLSQWRCTMMRAAYAGLPLSLDDVSTSLGLAQKKDARGKALIKYFCVPCSPTNANGQRMRNLPMHDAGKWDEFKSYCKQDVVVENAILSALWFVEPGIGEHRLWMLDQKINGRGVAIDHELVKSIIEIDGRFKGQLLEKQYDLTGLDNPNSLHQLRGWIEAKTGESIKSLDKEAIPILLDKISNPEVKSVLRNRQMLSKTSVSKFAAMQKSWSEDYRIRNLLQHYGANRTGRWAGRIVQTHNLPKNKLKPRELAMFREFARQGNLEALIELYGDNVPSLLSELIRTALVARPGDTFYVADFSSIEARVISWLAGEMWRLEVFMTHGKIYEASASKMFGIALELIGRDSPYRDRGKVSELALGYQGGVNALITMGALKMGIPESELQGLVDGWRRENPMIVHLWRAIGDAALAAVRSGHPITTKKGIVFHVRNNILFVKLPSGRELSYFAPRIDRVMGKRKKTLSDGTVVVETFETDNVTYMNYNQERKRFERTKSYGGKFVENIVQAIARDLLALAIIRLEKASYPVVMHVHDEAIIEMAPRFGALHDIENIMSVVPSWAAGLPLAAEGYETPFYRK